MESGRRNPRNIQFEYVLPSSWWTETPDSHRLIIDVPGFKKGEVRIRAHNNLDHVIVSGERQGDDNNKILHFEQSYKVPEGCNIQETSAILEDETYYVIIPKKANSKTNSNSTSVQDSVPDGIDNTTTTTTATNNNDDQNRTISRDEDLQGTPEKYDEEKLHRTSSGDEPSESSFLQKLSKNLKNKRYLALTAFLAFTLGVLVSHGYQSSLISYPKGTKKRATGDASEERNSCKNFP